MDIRKDVVVPLGYGKFIRSDKIIGLEPIEEDRGPGKRTYVYIEGIKSPMVASRTETAILSSIVETPHEVMEATAALELLKDILDDISQIGPMLRKSIKKEAKLDLEKISLKIEEIINHEIEE
jgi:RAB protein geranylgeranyltransferase component A